MHAGDATKLGRLERIVRREPADVAEAAASVLTSQPQSRKDADLPLAMRNLSESEPISLAAK